jgi:hypothetical protein
MRQLGGEQLEERGERHAVRGRPETGHLQPVRTVAEPRRDAPQ